MSTLLAKNAEVLVTMDGQRRELKNAGLYAEEGFIKQVGPNEELPLTADTVIDLSGQIVLPGFVNTHHHLNQTLTRNLVAAQNNNLFPWLQAQYRIWASTTEEASRASTLIGLAELALSGCTTVFDHTYVYKNGNNVDCQIQAAKDLGVRFHASRGSMSLGQSQGGLPPDDCVEDEAFILRDSERVIKAYHDATPGSMTQIALAPCSPFSVTISLLRDSAELARQCKVKLHTHLCETRDEERYTLDRHQLRPVDWMETHGWLGDDVWFAHAIHVDDDEIKKFVQTGCGVAHCPCSNMRLGSGIAPIKKYLAAGVKVGLGVDGSASNDASNILLEARQAMLLARLQMGLLPPEGPRKHFLLSQSHPIRAKRMDDSARGSRTRHSGRRAGAWTLRHRFTGAWKMRRFLLSLSSHHRLCRRAARSRGGYALLRPAKREIHRYQRQSHRAGRRNHHGRHEPGYRNTQPLRL